MNVLYWAVPDRISNCTAPVESFAANIGVETAVILFRDVREMVPLKSVVGVMVNAEVPVAVGPHVPVAVCDPDDCPPTVIVKLPAVLPVTVQLIWYLYPLVIVVLWVRAFVPPPPACANTSSGDSVHPLVTVQPAEVRSSLP